MLDSDVGRRNHVTVTGAGSKTIVLAHGFGSNQTLWRRQVEALSSRYRIVLFDHVGYGRSDLSAYSPRRYRTLQGYAMDLLEVLGAAEATRVGYVGHSMSGMIGVLAAIAQPERFEKLMLMCGSPRYVNEEGYRGGFDQADIDATYEAMSTNYHAWAAGFAGAMMAAPERPHLAQEFADELSAVRPDIAQAAIRVIFESDHRPDLPRLGVPTRIVQADRDLAVPMEVCHYMARTIPRADYVVIQASGHFPHVSAPEATIEAMLSYFD